jgi:hypothetical protein
MSQEDEVNQTIEGLRFDYRSKNIAELKEKAKYYTHQELACTAPARVILEEAMKLGVDGVLIDVPMFEDAGHVVVILRGMRPNDVCLHVYKEKPITVADAIKQGEDVTGELLSSRWKNLL